MPDAGAGAAVRYLSTSIRMEPMVCESGKLTSVIAGNTHHIR